MQAGDGVFWSATNIYLQATTLCGHHLQLHHGPSAGGVDGGLHRLRKADAYWTFSGGLAGVIATSAGNDLYHPIQAMLISAVIVVIIYKMHYWLERRFKIDDAVGAVAVHGYAGFLGVVAVGLRAVGLSVLAGCPARPRRRLWATVTPWGQIAGASHHVLRVLGFVPGLRLCPGS